MDYEESTMRLPFSVSVVVPVYNSEATLIELTSRINDVLAP
ncbi:hypothetical protein ACFLWA_02680 [Chloroflexota bacterium]